MSHAMKLLKFHCFSAVSLNTQLHPVLYPNNPNISSTSIAKPFPLQIPSMFYYHDQEKQILCAKFAKQIPMHDVSMCEFY